MSQELSDRAKAYFEAVCKQRGTNVGSDTATAFRQLDEIGCPSSPSFVRYLERYSRASGICGQPHYPRPIELMSIESRHQLVVDEAQGTGIEIVSDAPSESSYVLWADGNVSYYRTDDWQCPYVSSMEYFWEDKALQSESIATGRIVDRVSIPHFEEVIELAAVLDLTLITEASEQFIKWWRNDFALLGVSLRPDSPYLTASWREEEVDFDRLITDEITKLIPKAAEFRKSSEFRLYRKTGDPKFIRDFEEKN